MCLMQLSIGDKKDMSHMPHLQIKFVATEVSFSVTATLDVRTARTGLSSLDEDSSLHCPCLSIM